VIARGDQDELIKGLPGELRLRLSGAAGGSDVPGELRLSGAAGGSECPARLGRTSPAVSASPACPPGLPAGPGP
jgi:hypothetical protein